MIIAYTHGYMSKTKLIFFWQCFHSPIVHFLCIPFTCIPQTNHFFEGCHSNEDTVDSRISVNGFLCKHLLANCTHYKCRSYDAHFIVWPRVVHQDGATVDMKCTAVVQIPLFLSIYSKQ